jgi:putative tricarboxylic transport membrane protein
VIRVANWSLLFQAILLFPVGFVFCYYAWRIVRVKTTILVPMIGAIMITGIYALRGEPLDVVVAVGFGIFAWLMQKTDYPPLNFIVGMLLGPILEGELIRTYATFNGRWELLLHRPIFLILVVALAAMLTLTIRSERKRFLSERAAASPPAPADIRAE